MKKVIMRKLLCLVLAVSVFYTGCAGREANLVQIRQPGDKGKTCKEIETEMLFCQDEMARLLPKSDKTGSNIALGATGIIFIIPLFFMDLKQGEKKEMESYQQRYNYLFMIFQQKNCEEETKKVPEDMKQQKEQGSSVTNQSEKQSNYEPTKTNQKVSTNKTSEEAPAENLGRYSGHKEMCGICGKTIPKLEQHFVVDKKIVCKDCFAKLKSQN